MDPLSIDFWERVWSILMRCSINFHMILCSSCAHGIPCSSYGYAMLMLCSCYVYVAWIAWARVRLAPAGTPPTDLEQGKAYKWTRFPFTCQARFEKTGISLQKSSLFTSLFGFIFGSILGQFLDPVLDPFWNHFGAWDPKQGITFNVAVMAINSPPIATEKLL